MSQSIPIAARIIAEAKPASAERSFVSHARIISVLTLLSRILGMLRESVLASYFGAGMVSSAFTVAFKIPNLFRKLLGEGALSAAFIPLYAQGLKTSDVERANQFAAASVSLLTAILLAVTLVGEAALAAVIIFANLSPENLLMVKFTAIMLPYVLLICLTAFLGGILQVHKRFALPALSPVLLNVMHIAVVVLGARILSLRAGGAASQLQLQIRLGYWLAVMVLAAGGLQVASLMPALRKVGFQFQIVWRVLTPEVKKMLRLSAPVALSAGVLQLSVLIDTAITVALTRRQGAAGFHLLGHTFAFPMEIGAVARLNWAQFLYQFPLGVFAISLATAIFPTLSGDALERDGEKFKASLRHGILVTLWEGLAASIGLLIVRYPAIRLLFQRGHFTDADTQWVALSVMFYGSAIWAFSLQQILNRAYYAMHDTTTPLILSIVTLVVNTVVEVPLVFTKLGEAGMAAGTCASFALQAVVMLVMLDRRVGGLGLGGIAANVGKMILSCLLMALACWAVQNCSFYPRGAGNWASLSQLTILMATGAATYFLSCMALRVKYR